MYVIRVYIFDWSKLLSTLIQKVILLNCILFLIDHIIKLCHYVMFIYMQSDKTVKVRVLIRVKWVNPHPYRKALSTSI